MVGYPEVIQFNRERGRCEMEAGGLAGRAKPGTRWPRGDDKLAAGGARSRIGLCATGAWMRFGGLLEGLDEFVHLEGHGGEVEASIGRRRRRSRQRCRAWL